MRIQCISRLLATWSLPTMGMLFSLWQATMQEEQPTQALRSIDMPHDDALLLRGSSLRHRADWDRAS